MGTAKENIGKIALERESSWLNDAKARQANLEWKRRSFKIAVRILREIRAQKATNGMTQKKLAEMMGVTPQYINKVVKGKENLTLETITKIEQVLSITLIEVPSFETSQVIDVENILTKSHISRAFSILISEDIQPYCTNAFADATGTYG